MKQMFPLSSNKFWKKFIQGNISRVIIFVVALVGGLALQVVPSQSGVNVAAMLTFLLAGLMVLFMGLSAWYISAYIKSYYYSDDEGFITIRKGVFTPTEIHVQYGRIQDVYVDRDLFDRMFGLYDVHIATATIMSGMEAHIDGVDGATAEALKDFLLGRIKLSDSHFGAVPAAQQLAPENTVPVAPLNNPTPSPLANEISSKAYPLGSAWMISQLIGSIFWFAIILAFISFDLGSANKLEYFLIALVVGTVIFWGILLAQRSNYYFIFSPDFILYRTGFISIQERHIPYSKIQDVTVSRGFMDMIFGLWTVTIENAAQIGVGRYAQNSKVSIMSLTKDQADYIAAQARVILNQVGGQGNKL